MHGVVDQLVNVRVGIIRGVREIPLRAGSPSFFHYGALACSTEALGYEPNFSEVGGASISRDIALAKAIGEGVERYCSALFDVNEFPLCSYSEADFECVDPLSFALYTDEQYQQKDFIFKPFSRSTTIRWVRSLNLLTNRTIYVPAGAVFVPYMYYIDSGDTPIIQPISTGLACHGTSTQATISAICEVVERDAFTTVWQAGLSPPIVRTDTLDDRNRNIADRFKRPGVELTIFDITTDCQIPTIMAFLRDHSPESPAVTVAAATDPNSSRAVCKALEELAHTRMYMQQLAEEHGSDLPLSATDVRDQKGHLVFYIPQENARWTDFLFDNPRERHFKDIRNIALSDASMTLSAILETLRRVVPVVAITDITSTDVRELGLSVVRAVIPGLNPLCMGHQYRALGGRRCIDVPRRLGLRRAFPEDSDNPAPHPFP